MEKQKGKPERLPEDDIILHFCLDGVTYALKQNALTQEQAYEALKRWFPDVEILPKDLNEFTRGT